VIGLEGWDVLPAASGLEVNDHRLFPGSYAQKAQGLILQKVIPRNKQGRHPIVCVSHAEETTVFI
jgi:hypothetical protein